MGDTQSFEIPGFHAVFLTSLKGWNTINQGNALVKKSGVNYQAESLRQNKQIRFKRENP